MTIATASDFAQQLLDSPPQACKPLDGALQIPVALIAPSPLNPRKRWKPAKVAEMEADLRANRQIQPIRVRPNPVHTPSNGRPPYEIVVGETRWRAAPGAGLQYLDAIVADCTDQQLIQLALAENTKRQDLHPLEEADGYDALLRKPDGLQGYPSVQELAAGVGVSPSYVYQRLKLRSLCKAGRDAFLDGKFEASVALLIARMPSQDEQARATARIVAGWGGEPYSYRAAAEYLQKEFMLRLDLARFDPAATYLVAGPCADCPKRSGAAPDLFADITSGDMCQDARCYQAKAEEAHQALLQAARDAGRTVLQGAAARAVLPAPGATPVGHYRLDAPCPALSDSARTLRQILGSGFAQSIVLVDLPDTAPAELVTADAARKALKARGLLREQTSPGKKAATPKPPPAGSPKDTPACAGADLSPPRGEGAAQGAAREGEGKAKPLTEAQKRKAEDDRLRELHWLTLETFAKLLLVDITDRLRAVPELPLVVLRMGCKWLARDLTIEATTAVYGVMQWPVPERDARDHWHPGGWLEADTGAHIDRLQGRALGELLAVLLCAEDCTDTREPADLIKRNSHATTLAAELGIDLDAVLRAAKARAGAQQRGEEDGSAAGAARREPDPTATFIAQHGAAAGSATTTEAGHGHDDQTDEGAPHAD